MCPQIYLFPCFNTFKSTDKTVKQYTVPLFFGDVGDQSPSFDLNTIEDIDQDFCSTKIGTHKIREKSVVKELPYENIQLYCCYQVFYYGQEQIPRENAHFEIT